MNLFLFLDDWLLDSRVDIVRRFQSATFRRRITSPEGTLNTPTWNPARDCFEATVKTDAGLKLMESADGETWENGPLLQIKIIGDVPDGCALNRDMFLAPGGFDGRSVIFADADDPDPDRRYKKLLFPYTRTIDLCGGIEGGPGVVACSPDGIHWTMDTSHQWFSVPKGSDCPNNILYNPFHKQWQAICRAWNNDRRIAMTESADLIHWTQPRIILHPDVFDPPLFQFYGMPTLLYDNEIFIGAVQGYNVPSEEEPTAHNQGPHNSWSKWTGYIDGQLAYSYDGLNWLRTDRSPFIERRPPGEIGGGSVYPKMLQKTADRVIIHVTGMVRHHGLPSDYGLLVYDLRPEGFAFLESVGAWGRFSTRCLVPNSGEVTLNVEAPAGEVLAQVVDVTRKPLEGYTFDDCIPITGDSLKAPVQWKTHRDLSGLVGKDRIRLEFRMSDARVYSLRLDCGLYYTNTEKPVERP